MIDTLPRFTLHSLHRLARVLIPLSVLTAPLACEFGVRGSGVIESRDFSLPEFDEVQVEDGFQARLVMGDEYRVVIRADDNIIDDVEVTRRGSAMHIGLEDVHAYDVTLEAVITLPRLDKLTLKEASELEALDVVAAGSLDLSAEDGSSLRLSTTEEGLAYVNLRCEDASECDVRARAQETIAELHDASRGRLTGSSDSMTLLVSDASSLDAREFPVDTLNVRLHDASEAEVFVTDLARGKLSGASELDVYGDPQLDVTTEIASRVRRR